MASVKEFRPLGDRILIAPDNPAKKIGSIIIPDSVKRPNPTRGKVLATGPGMLMKNGNRWPMPVKPGNRIVYAEMAGVPVEFDEGRFLLIRDDAILAIEDDHHDHHEARTPSAQAEQASA